MLPPNPYTPAGVVRITPKHDSTLGVERAMRILRRVWLQRLAFDRLRSWRAARAAARVVRDALAAALAREAWVSWRDVVERDMRNVIVRGVW